jgi:hypothetical protein
VKTITPRDGVLPYQRKVLLLAACVPCISTGVLQIELGGTVFVPPSFPHPLNSPRQLQRAPIWAMRAGSETFRFGRLRAFRVGRV